eukprot:7146002-Prymnesium_polylepis.1
MRGTAELFKKVRVTAELKNVLRYRGKTAPKSAHYRGTEIIFALPRNWRFTLRVTAELQFPLY